MSMHSTYDALRHFADSFSRDNNFRRKTFTLAAMERLRQHGWRGNIRELRNTVERAMLLADSDELSASALLPLGTRETIKNGFRLPDDGPSLESIRDADPFHQRGLAEYDLRHWKPVIGTEGLDQL